MRVGVIVAQAERRLTKLELIKETLDRWSQNFETRRQLRALEEHQLRDIGIDQLTAEHEAKKPFWQN